MKRQIAMIALLFLGMGMTASAQFGKKFNVGKALQAGKDVVSAVTLSDADGIDKLDAPPRGRRYR